MQAYEALWDDVTKQFNKHADLRVIDQAVQTIAVLNEAATLGNTNAAKMGELEETLVSALREAVSGKDVESAAFEEDELLALTSCVLRISRLYAAHDMSAAINDTEDGKSRAWEIIDSLVERGRLGYKDEIPVRCNPLTVRETITYCTMSHRSSSTPSASSEPTSSGVSSASCRSRTPSLTSSSLRTSSTVATRSWTSSKSSPSARAQTLARPSSRPCALRFPRSRELD